jgi:hypothetical protein
MVDFSVALVLSGLILDLCGVGLLGFDLVRIQRQLRDSSRKRLEALKEMVEAFGGIESWAGEIRKSSRRIHQHEYWDHHSEDETSENLDRFREASKEHAINSEGLAVWISRLSHYLQDTAMADEYEANYSLKYSVAGLILISLGFASQILGITVGNL